MRQANALLERLIGRETETRRLHAALRKRQSQLIWGASDAGKSFLIAKVLAELPENERRKCICWAGAASRRQLIEHLVRGLYARRHCHLLFLRTRSARSPTCGI